jgi:hypothetical protein
MQRIRSFSSVGVPVLLLLAQCASSPSLPRQLAITKGQRTRVMLQGSEGGSLATTLALQNESAGSRDNVYSDAGGDRVTKVVEDADLQTLLDVLASESFFQYAAETPAPGSREAIAVEQGDRRWVFSRPTPRSPDDPVYASYLSFRRCHEYVRTSYNKVMSFHAQNLSGADLKREQQELLQRQEATKKLQQGGKNQEPPR